MVLSMKCPSYQSQVIVKNGFRSNDKQNHKCLNCDRQFVEQPENKLIGERIRKSLLERVSLEGVCRIFEVSFPWLLDFMDETIRALPEDLNAIIIEDDEVQIAVLELDELHSFVGKRTNDQWLWLAMHSKTRQILAFHVGKRTKEAASHLWAKIPEELKKSPVLYGQICSLF